MNLNLNFLWIYSMYNVHGKYLKMYVFIFSKSMHNVHCTYSNELLIYDGYFDIFIMNWWNESYYSKHISVHLKNAHAYSSCPL